MRRSLGAWTSHSWPASAPLAPPMPRRPSSGAGAFGIPFSEDGGYYHTEQLPGVNAFAIWPLSQAAQATFGTPEWPADRPVPQAWIEFDVDTPAAVAEAVRNCGRADTRSSSARMRSHGGRRRRAS